jgi:membrane dipeptidase
MTTTRRQIIAGAAMAGAFAMVNRGSYAVHAETPRRYAKRVVDLIRESLVIDMLGPLSLDMSPAAYSGKLNAQQIADFRASGINVFNHSEGIVGPDAYERSLHYFAAWNGFVARNAELFTLVDKAADIDAAKKQSRIAVIMGMQSADHFRKREDVHEFHTLGQRCAQLTYNTQNLIGSSCNDRVDGGLSEFGVQIVKAMNEAGMLIDISHCGERTTLDAIAISSLPIANTHGNCSALGKHRRNKSDVVIKALAAKGGIMGISGMRLLVSDTEPTTIVQVVDHIDHAVKLVGAEHVGIGTDADLPGYDKMPADQNASMRTNNKQARIARAKIDTDGFSGPLKMYNLVEELVRRNYSDEVIRAILGGNARRLLAAVWN